MASVKIGGTAGNIEGFSPTVFLQLFSELPIFNFSSEFMLLQGKCYKFFGPLKDSTEVPKYAQIYVHDPQCNYESTRLRMRFMKLPAATSPFECHALESLLQDLQVGY